MTQPNPVHQIIHKLGGPKIAAELISAKYGGATCTTNSVNKWIERDSVPWCWRSGLRELFEEAGHTATRAQSVRLSHY